MIYFLIVNFHSSSYLKNLLCGEEFQVNQWPVLVVNNSPADNDLYTLREYYSPLSILEAMDNIGFGKGCNLGLQKIYREIPQAIIWLLNPDTELIVGAVNAIAAHLSERPDLAILGTQIIDSNGALWFEAGQFNIWLGTIPHRGKSFHLSKQDLLPSRWVSGCSLILNLASFDHCPQFDPEFFLYYEDTDFCERYYRQGFAIAVTNKPWVRHYVSSTTNRNVRFKWTHATFSKLCFLEKHGTWLALWLNFAYIVIKLCRDYFSGNTETAQGRWHGLQAYLNRVAGEHGQGVSNK